MRRQKQTRRHPISIAEGISTRDAFLKERQILLSLEGTCNHTINTGLLSTSQNKERICDLFMKNGGQKMLCVSPLCPSGSSLARRRRPTLC